jgi:hypothetical protein
MFITVFYLHGNPNCIGFGYAPAPDNHFTWNFQRGAIAGILGAALVTLQN